MSISYWLDSSFGKKELETDIAIIGGGLTGVSLAYWLDKLGDVNVVLIERGRISSGATGRNAGFLLAGTSENYSRMRQQYGVEKAKAVYKLTVANHHLLHDEIADWPIADLGYTRCGSVTAAVSDEEFTELEESHQLMLDDGFQNELIGQEINESLSLQGFTGGLLNPLDGGINPVKFTEAVLPMLSDRVTVVDRNEVFEVNSHSGGVAIRSEHVTVNCEMAILATNGYAPALSKYLEGKVVPTRGQLLATAPVEQRLFGGHTVYCDFGFEYFRQTSSGALLVGGFRQQYKSEELGYSDETTANIQRGLEEFIGRHIPAARNVPITHRWSGVMGFSTDGLPLVGEIPGQSGVMFLGGFTGHGWGFAFSLAKGLAEQLLNGRTDCPLELFSLRRLG